MCTMYTLGLCSRYTSYVLGIQGYLCTRYTRVYVYYIYKGICALGIQGYMCARYTRVNVYYIYIQGYMFTRYTRVYVYYTYTKVYVY